MKFREKSAVNAGRFEPWFVAGQFRLLYGSQGLTFYSRLHVISNTRYGTTGYRHITNENDFRLGIFLIVAKATSGGDERRSRHHATIFTYASVMHIVGEPLENKRLQSLH